MTHDEVALANLAAAAGNYPVGEEWEAFAWAWRHPLLFPDPLAERLWARRQDGEEFWAALRAEGWSE